MTDRPLSADDRVQQVGQQMADYLEKIASLVSHDMKITLLIRHPTNPKSCLILSDENKADVDVVCETLRHLLVNPPKAVKL